MTWQFWLKAFAFVAIWTAVAPVWFFIFWTWFEFWRAHRTLTYICMAVTFVAFGVVVYVMRRPVFTGRIRFDLWVNAVGWALITTSVILGSIAHSQIGVRVRAFAPFFDARGRIELQTTGAFGVVRHPIYAAGIAFQLGIFLNTGYPAVALACAFFTLGALWFTRQEEARLLMLLDEPDAYDRYRERVPALIPRLRKPTG